MPRFSFYPVGGDRCLVVIAAAAVLLALLFLGPRRQRTGRGRRATLLGLRIAVFALVVLLMLRPTLVYTTTVRQSATLILLVDRSRSLSVPDEVGGRTRYQALRKSLEAAAPELAELAQEVEIKAYAFDAEALALPVQEGQVAIPETPQGDQTAIGAVLEDVLRQELGKRILGIVLLSDGAQRAYPPRDLLPLTVAGRLKRLGYPLFTVRFGKSRGLGQAQDVAVTELLTGSRVFVKNQLTVTGEVRAYGYVNRDLPVTLAVESPSGEMKPVDQLRVTVTEDGGRIPVQFTYVPEVPGEIKLALEVEERPGELVTTNNRLSTFVRVLAGGVNVLYLEGELRREISAIRNALGRSPDIDVQYIRIDPRHPETRPADLTDKLQPGTFDVYILGDLDSSVFQDNQLETLADTVSQGAGLIMIGGFHSFGPGGYAETPLARLLPVAMDRSEREPLDGTISQDLHLPEVKMIPTQAGLVDFTLRLADSPDANRALWDQLPPLAGANRFGGPRDGLPLATDQNHHPLLVRRSYGSGRVLAFAGDSTWRWPMHGFQEAHQRFWRQLVLWLARKDESLEGNVWIKFRQRRFSPGQRVEFDLGAQSATGEPVPGATFQVEVAMPDQTSTSVTPVYAEGRTSCSFRDTRKAGDYTVRVSATADGATLGNTQGRFVVLDQDLELDNPAADAPLLDNLANMAGGKSVTPEDLPALLNELTGKTNELEVRTETKKSLWDTWTTFALMVLLLSLEWYLRKRWGLV